MSLIKGIRNTTQLIRVIMNIADELSIPGNLGQVYSNLIDPEILKRCIPGCEELKKLVKRSTQQKWF